MFRLTEQSKLGLTSLIIFQIFLMNLSKSLACDISDESPANTCSTSAREQTGKSTTNICSTPTCERAATFLLANIDEDISPCNNFHGFVCGNSLKKSLILEDESEDTYFMRLNDEVTNQLRSSIEDEIENNDPQAIKQLKSFYQACMDKDQIEKNSMAEFVEILNNLGDWPVLAGNSWDETSFEWRSSMLKFRNGGFEFHRILPVYVKTMKDRSGYRVHVDPTMISVFQKLLSGGLENEGVKAYYEYMIQFAVQLGAGRKRAVEELRPVLDLEIKIANITMELFLKGDESKFFNSMSVAELQKSYSMPDNGPNWLEYLNGILQPHAHLRDNDTVIVASPRHLKALFELLEETPKRTQANHAFWGAADWAADRLSERINQIRRKFLASMEVTHNTNLRWLYCLSEAYSDMKLAVEALYVRRHVSKGMKESATELIANVVRSFKKTLEEVSWMDKTTKKSVLEKLEAMRSVIAYPDELLDDEKLNDYYNGLQIYPESYLRSCLNLNLFHMKRAYEKLVKPVDRFNRTSYADATTVNAMYLIEYNTMVFPAALLQEKIFDMGNPQFMNYAGLGSIAGHEMMHGFDEHGRRFDKVGNRANWWDENSEKEYLKRISCFVEQYQNYIVKTFNLNVTRAFTNDQDLADNSGIKEAYYAYEAWEKRNAPEPQLPGLEKYSPRQLFWMSYASLWCNNYSRNFLQDLVRLDLRPLDEYRINGPLSNMPEFARDFNCSKNSPMNPENRCRLW